MLSPEAEVESIRDVVAKHVPVDGVLVTPLALTFQVRPPPSGIDGPFDALRLELVPKGYVPTVTREKGETLVHVQRRPPARFAGRQVNLALLGLTILTTVFFGGAWNWMDYAGTPLLSVESIGWGTLFFSVPLLTILGAHEMGHYVVAKRHNVHASLPFFLPSVPPLGTFGAFISMRDPIPNRRALLDIGVSGPLVGFAIAIPVTLGGLALSSASPAPATGASQIIQPSLLFGLLSQFFPLPETFTMHPLAFAGWVGLFVTAINLLPAGQLDGGHVARALLGRRQFYVSWGAVLVLFGMTLFTQYPGWFLFGFLILMLGVRHPPPLNDLTRLDGSRKLVGIAAIGILVLTFVPVPFLQVDTQTEFRFEALDGAPILDPINQTIALGEVIVITFALNNTGQEAIDLVVTARNTNLEGAGFLIRFSRILKDGNTATLDEDTVRFRLNATERAVLDLQVTAPGSPWGGTLPWTYDFAVLATAAPEGRPQEGLPVDLTLTA
jgi:membrane-associated protease RseP (regulator of RpoE activity)